MRKFLWCLLVMMQSAYAANPIDDFSKTGPFKLFEVTAPDTPTPYMTGYIPETNECHLLVNVSVDRPTGLADTVAVAHELGHCYSLRLKVQQIDGGVTQYGEAFGDVFALAWISKNMPAQLDAAMELLWGMRSMNRMINPAYNTMFIMRRARLSLPTTMSPEQFTVTFLGS